MSDAEQHKKAYILDNLVLSCTALMDFWRAEQQREQAQCIAVTNSSIMAGYYQSRARIASAYVHAYASVLIAAGVRKDCPCEPGCYVNHAELPF